MSLKKGGLEMATRSTVILHRSMFYDPRWERVRIFPFYVVETSLGTMWEPRSFMDLRVPGSYNIKQDDIMCLVDELRSLDGREQDHILNPSNRGNVEWMKLHAYRANDMYEGYEHFGERRVGVAGG